MKNTTKTSPRYIRWVMSLFMLLLLWNTSTAQTTVTIGSGTTTTSYFPIYSCYGYNYSQQIYTAAEMSAAGAISGGTITQIKFMPNAATANANFLSWTVYLGNTGLANLANTSGWVPVGSMTQVFSGNIPTLTAGGWMTLNLSAPFTWTGGNLVVAVDENTPGYTCTALWRSFTTTAAAGPRGILYYSDTNNPNPAAPPIANYSNTTVRAQIQMTMTGGAACTGTPAPGNTLSSVVAACAGTPFTLSLQNSTAGSGVSYQWQSSPNASTWTNIAGATFNSYSATQSSLTYYQCIVTCSGSSNTSTPVVVAMNSVDNCYCTNTGTNTGTYYISNVTTTGGILNINNTTGGTSGGYANYTASQVLSGYSGTTFNWSVTCGPSGYTYGIGVWVDWNHNGSFADAGEQLYNSGSYVTGASGSATIPAGAYIGDTRMRVVANYFSTSPTACTGTAYTEAEDYTVRISVPPPMTFTNTNAQQQTGLQGAGAVNVPILRVKVVTSGAVSPFNSETFTFTTNGTIDPSIIANAKLYYTGATGGTFSATTQVGSTVLNPNGTFTITSSQTLLTGDNFFWLTYDIVPSLVGCKNLDATYEKITILGTDYFPGTSNPSGDVSVAPTLVANNLSPANGSSNTCRNVTLSWSAVAPYAAWDLYIDGALYASNITATSYTVAIAGTHTWELAAAGTTPNHCVVYSYTAGPNLCYCIPTSTYGCTDYDVIGSVSIATTSGTTLFSNATYNTCPGGTTGFSDYTALAPASLMQGYTYNVTVQADYFGEGYAVWIDANDDGIFDNATERVGYTNGTIAGSGAYGVLSAPATFPITLTCGSPLGQHRMRVRCVYATSGANITPCGAATWGEVEDYFVNFIAGPTLPPVATNITGPSTGVCSPAGYNNVLTYTVDPGYSGLIQWQYSLDNITYVDITNATSTTQGLVASGPASYYLRVKYTGQGCVPPAYSNSINVVISAPTAYIASSGSSICRGSSVTLTANSTVSGPYAWSTAATTQSVTVSPLVNTSYSVTVGSGLCTANVTETVNIIGGPIATSAVTPSAAHCPGSQVALSSSLITGTPGTGNYTYAAVPFTTVAQAGTIGSGPAGDDVVSGSIALPFPFNFYGTTYNSIVISTNGFISFDAAPGSGCCSGQSLPNTGTPNNVVALAWTDLNTSNGGNITYWTNGNSFVVSFNSVAVFSGTGAVSGQIVLNSDGTIQINSTNILTTGTTTQGIENSAGTLATFPAGLNAVTPMGVVGQSYLFTPPQPVTFNLAGPVTYNWSGSNGFSSTNANAVDNPVGTTTYTLTVSDGLCSSSTQVTSNVFTAPTAIAFNGGPYCDGQTASFFGIGSSPYLPPPPVVGGNYTVASVPYSTVTGGTPSAGPSGDDAVGGPYTLPFSFSFYGTSYNSVYISTNGFLSFTNVGAGCCSGQAFPNSFGPVVALGWTDLNTGNGGNIEYFSTGNSFVVNFNGVGLFSGAGGVTGQIVLNSNGTIQINSTNILTTGTTSQGIGNGATYGTPTPGANAVIPWSASNVSYLFTPPSSGPAPAAITYNWSGPNGFSSTLQNPILTASTANSGFYTMTVTDVNGCTTQALDYLTVNENPVVDYVSFTDETCPGYSDGTMEIGISGGDYNYTITDGALYTTFGSPAQFTGVSPGTYNFSISDGNLCPTSATVTVGTVPNVAPVLVNCPSNINLISSPTSCGAVATFTPPTATDNCPVGLGSVIQTAGLPSGSLFPVGTTTNTFSVTDAEGATVTCSFNVSVVDNNPPSITNVPANFSSCNPVTWTPPTITDNCAGVQITSSHVPGANFPSGTTTVTYTAVDVYGNTSSASFNVTLLEPSVAAAGVTSNRDFNNICLGENITLTLNGGSLGAGASWKWYKTTCGGATNFVGSGTTITVAPTATTTYYVRAEGTCNTTACASLTVVVTTSAPTSAPVFTYVPANAAPGVNDSLVVAPVVGATYYRWFTNNGHLNSVLFNGVIGPKETGVNRVNVSFILPEQNYQLRVIAGNACGRTNQTNATVRGTVAAATCINGPTQVCPGQTIAYTACAIPSQTSVSYAWQIVPAVPGTATITYNGTNATVNYLPGFTSAQLCVNGISTFGLAGPSYCINVSTNAPTPGAITGLLTPCEGSTQTYSIAAVPNATTYTWSTNIAGAVVTGTGTSASIQFPANAFAGTVSVVANSSCGVSAPSTLSISSGTPGVPGPISGPVAGICNASNVNYSLGTSNANSYSWALPTGVTISGASNLNAVNLNFGAGFVGGTIVVTAYYDCGSATSSITVDGAPSAPSLTPSVICPSSDQLYTASSTGATSYNWIVSGDDYSACTNPPVCSQYYILWGAAGGSMSVTASNSCGTSPATAISGSSCRMNENGELTSKVYPNPTTGILTVEFTALVAGDHQITVTDISGRVVTEKVVKASAGISTVQDVDLSTSGEGFYMLYIKDPKGHIAVSKVTVE